MFECGFEQFLRACHRTLISPASSIHPVTRDIVIRIWSSSPIMIERQATARPVDVVIETCLWRVIRPAYGSELEEGDL